MIVLNVLLVLCSIHPLVNGLGFRGFTFEGWEDPEPVAPHTKDIREGWITQRLDHFNHRDNHTWSMRYYENTAFLKKDSPIFIMIGGEWRITPGMLRAGLMYEVASKHRGLMYYTEHRFYGESKPTKDTSAENLQHLNVDQALADLAYFIETKKKEENLENSPVIVFGGSYAGNMAAWARLKYPHLIQGAIASSAPVYAKADFYEYFEIVARSLGRSSKKCVTDTKAAFESIEKLLTTPDGPKKLKTYFNMCNVPNVKSSSHVGFLTNLLAETFAGVVQYNSNVNGRTTIAMLCGNMTAENYGSPLQRLARIVTKRMKPDQCFDVNYDNFVKTLRQVSWNSTVTASMRQWYHQTCTEYGYYQTSSTNKSIFGKLFPLSYYINLCTELYGDYYNKKLLNSQVKRTNIMYGGYRPDLTNVIFTNGDIDPWHPLSVLKDLNAHSPAILINGSSHCNDLQPDAKTDSEDLKRARVRIRSTVDKWLSS